MSADQPPVRTLKLSTLNNGIFPVIQKLFRKNDFNHYERNVLMNIIGRQGRNDSAFPSQETISDDLGFSVRQVQRALHTLSEKGIINKKRRGFGMGNAYVVNVEALLEWAGNPDDIIPAYQADMAPFPPTSRVIPASQADMTTNRLEVVKSKGVKTPRPLTEEELEKLRLRFGPVFPDLSERIEDIMAHSSAKKWESPYHGVRNWLRGDEEKIKNRYSPTPRNGEARATAAGQTSMSTPARDWSTRRG